MGMKPGFLAASVALAAAAAGLSAHAKTRDRPGNIRAGRELAQAVCAECHIVVPRPGVLRQIGDAPDFADVAQMPSTTRMSLFAFLHSSHPTMPNPILSDRKAKDVVAYILSLKRPEKP
jgi:mono/diheme cytochrome c family protein